MGCDGGTIPRRDELVRTKKKPEEKDKDSEREFRWLHCAISQQRLQEPVVMCGLGRLYLKEVLIECLLDKDTMPESAKHIKSMKDIKTLKLTPNPVYVNDLKTEGLLDARNAPFICKLMGIEMSGKLRFIGLWSCGCVMSERAFKEIKSSTNICALCQTPYEIEDVIVLNGNEEDVELMEVKMEMRNKKRKLSKKDKKKINSNEQLITEQKVESNNQNSEAHNTDCKPSTSKVIATSTSTSTVTSNSNKKVEKTSHKVVLNSKRASEREKALMDPDIKRLKTNYSVAKDPKATDVYKSLFTSHKDERDQTRAHWVTYNPFYN